MEQHGFAEAALAETLWEETDRDTFASAWAQEIAGLPEFTDSAFHIATGLLLPIWRRLPDENCRVYRLQTDEGERIIGRLVSPAALGALCRNLGLDDVPALSPEQAWQLLIDGSSVVRLADGLQLRRVRVMNEQRIELTGFTSGMRDRLTATGLMHEIIAWKLRFFVPVGAGGPEILGRLMARHPLTGLADRAAA
jgi:protein strawberry notch